MSEFKCSECGNKKALSEFHKERGLKGTNQCRKCRSEAYYRRRYPRACAQCEQHRKLDSNGVCSPCNLESGLRQCRGKCGELLPYYLSFSLNRYRCKKCEAELRRLRDLERSGFAGDGS